MERAHDTDGLYNVLVARTMPFGQPVVVLLRPADDVTAVAGVGQRDRPQLIQELSADIHNGKVSLATTGSRVHVGVNCDPEPMARMTYEQTMAFGAEQYRDVLDALASAGLPAVFIQTGGMNAALEVSLDGGAYLLLTDLEDTLSWNRDDHAGWYVGLYEAEEKRTVDGPLRWLEHHDGSADKAVELARRVLRGDGR